MFAAVVAGSLTPDLPLTPVAGGCLSLLSLLSALWSAGFPCTGLSLSLVALSWAGLSCVGLSCAGLSCAGLSCASLVAVPGLVTTGFFSLLLSFLAPTGYLTADGYLFSVFFYSVCYFFYSSVPSCFTTSYFFYSYFASVLGFGFPFGFPLSAPIDTLPPPTTVDGFFLSTTGVGAGFLGSGWVGTGLLFVVAVPGLPVGYFLFVAGVF